MRIVTDPDGDLPLPGMHPDGITRAQWHALLDDLLELERAGALGGIRAAVTERLSMVRAGVSFSPEETARAAEAAMRSGKRAVAAALLAAAVDRDAELS
jgi:hypothetical protein